MPWLAFFSLILWFPIVLYLFEKYSTQKAIVFSFITAWLFLPPTQIPLPGFPDWSKTSATVVSVSLCCWLKNSQRLFAVRPRWYDVPVVVYCLCPFASSIANGLGAYDGLSAALDETVRWGLPYLTGRAYLADASGNRQLCLGMAMGGMLYVPFCLYEIRMSPMLKSYVYGFAGGRDVDFGLRYGGYRPMVFLSTGLELGWWMCCATLAGFMLWRSTSVKRLYGYPMAALTAILACVTVICKSTGALLQITLGFVLIYVGIYTKRGILLWAVLAIGPVYCMVRPTGLWTGGQVVEYAASTFGAERAQSLAFRFEQEEILMASANQRPIFGWSRSGGFPPADASGKIAITDGLWILIYGWYGSVGLGSLNLMLLVPTALFLSRFKPETWMDRDVAPVTTFAIILPLFMVDNLSNAMPNPIYALAMGSVAGYIPSRRPRGSKVDQHRSFAVDEQLREVLPIANQRGLRRDLTPDAMADQFEAQAQIADEEDRVNEAAQLFEQAVQSRQAALRVGKTSARLDLLARSHVLNARFLTKLDQIPAAISERDRALAVWRAIEESDQVSEQSRDAHAANLNDLAWLLVMDESSVAPDVDRAIQLAEEAVAIAPGHAPFWNTLGLARYRHQDYYKAIHALSQSISLSDDGGNAFDFYYLALANQALGYTKPSTDWFDRAEAWGQRHPELGQALGKVRQEAANASTQAKIS